MDDTGCASANMADGCDVLEQQLADPGSVVRLFRHGEAVDAVMKLISEADADVVEAKPDGTSLLHSFTILGCYDVVKLLWERGARPTILKVDDSTILHSVVRAQDDSQDTERARILELFLSSDECGGNSMPLDHQNSKGWTALKLAARKNLEKCVEVLLEHGADPDVVDNEQYTALHNAVNNPDILKLLLTKTKNVNMQNQDGETALYLAAERGLTDSALTLLEYGADPNIPNKEGTICAHAKNSVPSNTSCPFSPPPFPPTSSLPFHSPAPSFSSCPLLPFPSLRHSSSLPCCSWWPPRASKGSHKERRRCELPGGISRHQCTSLGGTQGARGCCLVPD